MLYVDCDMIFLRPVEDLWKIFSLFNASQIAAASEENEEENKLKYYPTHARAPFYGERGNICPLLLLAAVGRFGSRILTSASINPSKSSDPSEQHSSTNACIPPSTAHHLHARRENLLWSGQKSSRAQG